jgi:hypothetical protein
MKITRKRILIVLFVIVLTAVTERLMGRLWFGPDGKFGLYSWNIWSSEQSQRVLDPYAFSHFIHGMFFFALLWPLRHRLSPFARFVAALALEAAWEILENSPIIIDRYRAVTVSFGYTGDSILNSVSDIMMAGLGFWFASKNKLWVCLAVGMAFELFTLWWVRDNLTLNVIMLTFPQEAIRQWQGAIAPH